MPHAQNPKLWLVVTALGLTACSGSQPAPTPAQAPSQVPAKAPQAPAPEAAASAAGAKAEVGKPAPDFSAPDLAGREHSLKAHAGKIVVLEWWNPQCPFVGYAHGEGPLKTMATDVAGTDLVWLAVNSGAPGKQGHGVEANTAGAKKFGIEHPILLDERGQVGRMYGAEKTPHVFVIDKAGVLVYAGGLDNAPFGEVDGEGPVENYVAAAIASARAGTPVEKPTTPAYGCTVKYGS